MMAPLRMSVSSRSLAAGAGVSGLAVSYEGGPGWDEDEEEGAATGGGGGCATASR